MSSVGGVDGTGVAGSEDGDEGSCSGVWFIDAKNVNANTAAITTTPMPTIGISVFGLRVDVFLNCSLGSSSVR